jgi:hypothetical protein
VTAAAGTWYFEPDGVVFSRPSLLCPIPPTGGGESPPLPVALSDRSALALHDVGVVGRP